jgi:hypothetical protein
MEARFGDPSTKKVSVTIPRSIEGNREVEYASRRLARSRGDDTRVALLGWNAHSALVRMSGKIFDDAGRTGIPQKLVYGTDRLDPLPIAVSSRMIVRPGDRLGLSVIA